jgi:hypothetical protein
MSVDDSELSTNLQNYPLSFFAGYNNTDIVAQVTASGVPPNLITCIKWYAPNTILVGTRRYKLSMYPNGWLIAQLSMTKTNLVDNRVFPGEITFIQYKTRPAEMPDQQGHIASMPVRSPDDVTPVELGVFSIANFQTEHPLSTYIPEIPDKTAVVTDRRMGNLMIRVASSGKWWMARELYEQHAASVAPRKKIIAIFLLLFSLIPLVLIIKFRMSKETASKNI